MYPYVYILGIRFPTYTIFCGLGFIAAIIVMNIIMLKRMLIHKYMSSILLALPGILFGGKFFGILSFGLRNFFLNGFFLHKNSFFQSGIVYYGGLFGYLWLEYIICRIKRLDFTDVSTIIAIGIPLFHFFGRIGCFFAGCCYGIESDVWFAIPYKIFGNKTYSKRIPVQLIEALFELYLFIFLYYLYNINKSQQLNEIRLLDLYLTLYAFFRFVIEKWRGDEIRGVFGCISFSQIVSIIVIIIIIFKKITKERG